MTILKHKGILSHKGLLLQKGILYANGLLPPDVGFGSCYQWIIKGKDSDIIQVGANWFYDNFGTGGDAVRTQIKNTQVLTIEAGIYMTFIDLNGATVVSNDGTSTPSKINDQRIDFTAGTLWNLVLSNGSILFCNDRTGVRIVDYLGIHDGTLIGANQTVAWGTKSSEAEPVMLTKGGGQYLDTITAGTSATLADPSGNLGNEEIINGTFPVNVDDWVGNNANNVRTWESGAMRITNLADFAFAQQAHSEWILGDIKCIEFDILENNSTANVGVGIGVSVTQGQIKIEGAGRYKHFFEVTATKAFQIRPYSAGTLDVLIDNISVKNVEFIPLLGILNMKLKPTISDVYYLDSNDITSGNGYMIRTTPTSITLFRIDTGTPTQLDTASITYVDYNNVTPIFTGSGITVDVIGVEELSSNDTTYTTFKFMVVDNDAGDSIHAMSKDGVRYDPMHFVDGTGVYKVRNSIQIGTTGLDTDGNPVEFAAFCGFWNTGNTLNPNPNNDAGLIALWTNYLALNVLLGDNVTFDELNSIDLTGIPKEDYTQEEKDGCILNMASEPFEPFFDVNGDAVYVDNKRLYVLKNF